MYSQAVRYFRRYDRRAQRAGRTDGKFRALPPRTRGVLLARPAVSLPEADGAMGRTRRGKSLRLQAHPPDRAWRWIDDLAVPSPARCSTGPGPQRLDLGPPVPPPQTLRLGQAGQCFGIADA